MITNRFLYQRTRIESQLWYLASICNATFQLAYLYLFMYINTFFRNIKHIERQTTQELEQLEKKSLHTICSLLFIIYEQAHGKTNKMACAPSEDSDQSEHPPSLIRVFAVRSMDS